MLVHFGAAFQDISATYSALVLEYSEMSLLTNLQQICSPRRPRLSRLPTFRLHCRPNGPAPDLIPWRPVLSLLHLVPLKNGCVESGGQPWDVEHLAKRCQRGVLREMRRSKGWKDGSTLGEEGEVEEVALSEVSDAV